MVGAPGIHGARISSLEGRSHAALDKFISVLERGEGASGIAGKLKDIEMESNEIASIRGEDEMELNEMSVMLEKLSGELEEACAVLPDAVLASMHEKITENIETAMDNLQVAKREYARANDEDNGAAQRRLKASAAKKAEAAEMLIDAVEEMLEKRPKMPANPLERSAGRARGAVAKARADVEVRLGAMMKGRISAKADKLRVEMKMFLQRHLEGRIFVDSAAIRLSSGITGQSIEFAMDDVSCYALEQMLSDSSLAEVLPRVKDGSAHIAAKFECRPSGDGLLVDIDAGERTVVGGSIVFKPHRARVAP